MNKMTGQKFKYLENEKSFYDEIKSIFHHFSRAFTEANEKKFFLEGESPTLKIFVHNVINVLHLSNKVVTMLQKYSRSEFLAGCELYLSLRAKKMKLVD